MQYILGHFIKESSLYAYAYKIVLFDVSNLSGYQNKPQLDANIIFQA